MDGTSVVSCDSLMGSYGGALRPPAISIARPILSGKLLNVNLHVREKKPTLRNDVAVEDPNAWRVKTSKRARRLRRVG